MLLGTALTWVAGFVDAVCYLTLSQIYTANMSGNTVGLGIELTRRSWIHAISRGLPIASFVPGVLGGMLVVEGCKRWRLRAALAPALIAEIVLLSAFVGAAVMLMGNHGQTSTHQLGVFALLVSLAGVAMGIQNGALQQVGALQRVHTYVTGTLVAAMESLSEAIWWGYDRLKCRRPGRCVRVVRIAARQVAFQHAFFSGCLWTGYLIGACVGVWLLDQWGLAAVTVPMGILTIAAIEDWFCPLWRPGNDPAARGKTGEERARRAD